LLLAIFGLFKPWFILGTLFVFWVTHLRNWCDCIDAVSIRPLRNLWLEIQPVCRALLLLAMLIFILKAVHALAPPVSYDALMYHLVAPQKMLEAGRVVPFPENWPANCPLTIQILFSIGLGFQGGSFARLLHLSLGIILLYAVYRSGRSLHSHNVGIFAVLILIGIPILPSWASWAYADMGWAIFELLTFIALLYWSRNHEKAWLYLAALCGGLSAGTKYLGLSAVGIGVIFIVLVLLRQGWKTTISTTFRFGLTATVVASPWYIKNLLLMGNPFFPFIFGGEGWDSARVDLLVRYHQSFGTGRTLRDYLLLPINIYIQQGRFSTFGGSIEIPSILFPLAILYPWKRNRCLDTLAILSVLRILIWAIGSQQIRHLLPAFPLLSLLTAYTIFTSNNDVLKKGWRWMLGIVLTGGMVATSLVYAAITMMTYRPLPVVIGQESEASFLRRNIQDFGALEYAQEYLPSESKIFMLWDARTYYCAGHCLPDDDHSHWSRLVQATEGVEDAAQAIKTQGAEYLLISLSDVDFHLQHDPTNIHHQAYEFFHEMFQPQCTNLLYRDEWTSLYRITCGVGLSLTHSESPLY
jgi:4-amino-4-deoxy-L-arabinose transferase-like glycosyltransferase